MIKKTILTTMLMLLPAISQVSAMMPRDVLDREMLKLEMKKQTIEILERELQEKSIAFEKSKEKHVLEMKQRELFLSEKEKALKLRLKDFKKALEDFEREREDFAKSSATSPSSSSGDEKKSEPLESREGMHLASVLFSERDGKKSGYL